MVYQIDQSNKIEETARTTYVSLTNGKTLVCSISSVEKKILKQYFRSLGKPLIFKLFTFSVLCARLVQEAQITDVVIDREYVGHERQIKSFILQIFRIDGIIEPEVNFDEIGKKSKAHIVVYDAMKKKQKSIAVNARQVWKYYEKVDKK